MTTLTRLLRSLLALSLIVAAPAAASPPELEALFKDFRAIVPAPVVNGAPDYGDAAMARRQAALKPLMARLAAIDDSQWPVADRVDYMLVLAEMRGLDFQYRVHRPWKRDPAFYSATRLGFGPKIDGAFSIPKLPLSAKQAKELAEDLAAVPAIYAQARTNLTEVRGDLARLGITQKNIEINVYDRLAADTAKSNPDVSRKALAASTATTAFRDWLVQVAPTAPAHGGIGREDYDWYLKHVLLFPYTSDEMKLIAEREYERAMVFLKLEEHKNRAIPMIEPADSLAEFERRRNVADRKLIDFLKTNDVMTVPDWLQPVVGEGPYIMPDSLDPKKPGPFDPPVQRHFFRQTEDREPTTLRAHNVPGHLFDSVMRKNDKRPIRGAERLFFISGTRVEGWAFYLEEMIQQLGMLDDNPKGREINYILHAKRAARVLPELNLHANEWTYAEALKSLTTRTPYWMGPNDGTARFDLELYLRQPGYGIGYHIGKVQFEALMSEVAAKEGRTFELKRFHDRFHSYGVIPISLIRWEMTGNDDQIKTMR